MLLLKFSDFDLEAGCDEAGRGCLAGPVFSAAVVFNKTSNLDSNSSEFMNLVNDSKKISEKTREKLRPIIEATAHSFAVTAIYPKAIDSINILNASILGMQESILKLKTIPNYVIIDGNSPFISKNGFYKEFCSSDKTLLNNLKTKSIVKGDSKYISIAAASILAKTYRDKYMNLIHDEHPEYNWKKNKGYPTKEHREAIKKFGLTKYHRLSFKIKD